MLPFLPSKLLKNLEASTWKINKSLKCNCCGKEGALTFSHALFADFVLEKYATVSWIHKFKDAEDGVCMTCGHFQRYTRLTEVELKEYNSLFSDKSKTSEGVISENSRYAGENYRENIIRNMHSCFYKNNLPKKIYIARPTSLKLLGNIQKIFQSQEIDYVENNKITREAIEREYEFNTKINSKNGMSVHGRTDFPEGYQLYIIIHCLHHSINLKEDLDKLEKRVKQGSQVLLLDEIQRKIHNPFHVNHLSEYFLTRELLSRGLRVKLIQDTTTTADDTIRGLQSASFFTGILVYD